MRLAFELADWLKQIALLNVVGFTQSTEGMNRIETLTLSLSNKLLPAYRFWTRTLAFFLPLNSKWNIRISWVSSLQPCEWNYPIGSHELANCRSWDLPASIRVLLSKRDRRIKNACQIVDHLKLPLIEVQWTTKILFLEETTGPKWEKIDIAERARLARMAISTLTEIIF